MKTTAFATVLFLGLPLAQASTSFLITNGTFETGNTSGWSETTGAPFMDVAGSCNDGFQAQSSATGCTTGTNPAFGTYAAYSSTTFPAISNNVGEWDNYLSQSFLVPTSPIVSATLTLDYTAIWGSSGSFFHGVNVEAAILQGTTYIDSVDFVINPFSGGSVPWTLDTTDLTSLLQGYQGQALTLQLISIGFYDTRGGGTGNVQTLSTGFDNVQITVQGTPEPSTMTMAAAGILIVFAGARRARLRT